MRKLNIGKEDKLVDAVGNSMSGGVDDGGEGGVTDKTSGSNSGGVSNRGNRVSGSKSQRSVDSERRGESEGVSVGDGSVDGMDQRSGGSGKMSERNDSTSGTGVMSKVSRTSSKDFRGFSGSNGESVAVYTVTESISNVVSTEETTVGRNITEGSNLVAISVLDSTVGLGGFRVTIAGLSKFILSVVLGLDTSDGCSNDSGSSNNSGSMSNNSRSSNGAGDGGSSNNGVTDEGRSSDGAVAESTVGVGKRKAAVSHWGYETGRGESHEGRKNNQALHIVCTI